MLTLLIVFINLGTAKQVILLHWGIAQFDCNEIFTCFSCKSNVLSLCVHRMMCVCALINVSSNNITNIYYIKLPNSCDFSLRFAEISTHFQRIQPFSSCFFFLFLILFCIALFLSNVVISATFSSFLI